MLDLLDERRFRRQQHRHRDHGARARRNAVEQREARQDARADFPHHPAIDERDCGIERGQQPGETEPDQPVTGRLDPGEPRQHARQQQRGKQPDTAEITAETRAARHAPQPQRNGRAIADRRFERRAAARQQVVTRVRLSIRRRVGGRRVARPPRRRIGDDAAGNLQLADGRSARQRLDRVAIQVARGEIHLREARVAAQHLIDQTDALEQIGPVHLRNQPHAGDHVAHGQTGGALLMIDGCDNLVRRRAARRQVPMQPRLHRRDGGIVIVQPLNQLHRERIVRRRLLIAGDERLRLHLRVPTFAEQAIRERVGVEPRAPVVDDLIREPPQVFDQHDPQRDRHRP
ncbi:hypothetical protein [Burkholderia oklahomensis]|uniref:hypothetical protein n=1 Tax=Burkholderia oklahomensis TaxID=342113 RepID=UPI001E29118E|nr:hypothetical protein [Burkholderia oklahomensis]